MMPIGIGDASEVDRLPVYKPPGVTGYGCRKRDERRRASR
jgi:hypothetical protein